MLRILLISLCAVTYTVAQSISGGLCPDNTWAALEGKCVYVELSPTPSFYAAESACKYRGGNLYDDSLGSSQKISNYVSYAKTASYGETAPYAWVALAPTNDVGESESNSVDIVPQCTYISASDPSSVNHTDCLKADLGYVCVADMIHLTPVDPTTEEETTTTPSTEAPEKLMTTTFDDSYAVPTDEMVTQASYVRPSDDDESNQSKNETVTPDPNSPIASIVAKILSEPTNDTTVTESPCNEGWTQSGSSCYYLLPNSPSMTWAETHAFCQAFNAHMLEINDQDEFDRVQDLVTVSNWTDGAWIGLYRQSITYDMEYDDDDVDETILDSSFKKYLMALPTQLGGGLCLGYSPHGDMYGYYDCSGLGNPFCEKNLKMSNETDDTDAQEQCPEGWTLSPTGTTCYWFDGEISDLTYNNVSDFCEDKGGIMVQPITPWEDQIVREIVQNNTWTQGPWVGIKRVPTSVSVVVPSQRSAPVDTTFAHYLNTVAMFNSNGSCAGFDVTGQTFQFWNCADTGNAACEIDLIYLAQVSASADSDNDEDDTSDDRRK